MCRLDIDTKSERGSAVSQPAGEDTQKKQQETRNKKQETTRAVLVGYPGGDVSDLQPTATTLAKWRGYGPARGDREGHATFSWREFSVTLSGRKNRTSLTRNIGTDSYNSIHIYEYSNPNLPYILVQSGTKFSRVFFSLFLFASRGLLRGTIVNRTYGIHKKLYISPFLLRIFGPINYGPP